jgi:hypothetical protein
MANYKISINQLADFSDSTEAGKRRIIKQQLIPDTFRTPWYQLPKARIKKCIEYKGDLQPIKDALEILAKRNPITKRQTDDKRVSIAALERFITIKLPAILKQIDYTIIKHEVKIWKVNDVDIIVAPEVIIKGNLKGNTVLGAVKIHISQSNSFDLKQAGYVATSVYNYLMNNVAKPGEVVLPELCICLDIFGARLVKADINSELTVAEIKELCEEIKAIWEKAAA